MPLRSYRRVTRSKTCKLLISSCLSFLFYYKALILHPNQPTLLKNTAAIQASLGSYSNALSSLNQALLLNASDTVNYRNLAKIKAAMGDTKAAFDYNAKAIILEEKNRHAPQDRYNSTPSILCYRTTAVQNIILGGDVQHSLDLISHARRSEGKSFNNFEHVSSHRTEEIINKISNRSMNPIERLDKLITEGKEDKEMEEAVRKGNVASILKQRFFVGKR